MKLDVPIPYNNLKTLNGLTIPEALAKLQARLEDAAYKQVRGSGVALTDIRPAWQTEVFTEVFGPCGVGWNFGWDKIEAYEFVQQTQRGERHVWQADILDGWLTYILTDGQDQWQFSIPSTGGSDNDVKEYAVRGAVTNMIGAASSKLLWQLPIYKGQGDERPADEQPQARKPATQTAGKPVPPKAEDDRPWFIKAIEFAKEHKDAVYDKPLGQSELGQRVIKRLNEEVGPDKWFMAKAHVANAVKKYTGFAKSEEMGWPDFEKLVRVYAGPYARPGDKLNEVLFHQCLKPTDWQALLGELPVPDDMVLSEAAAEAINAAFIHRKAYVKDGVLDVKALAATLIGLFVQTADDATQPDMIPADDAPTFEY